MSTETFIEQYEKAIYWRDTSHTAEAIALFEKLANELANNPDLLGDDKFFLEGGGFYCRASFYDDFAYALGDDDQLEKALYTEEKALSALEKMQNRHCLETIYINYSDYAMQLGEFQKTLSVLKKGIESVENEKLNHKYENLTALYINAGLCHYFLGEENQAEVYLKVANERLMALNEADRHDVFDEEYFEVNYFLSEIYQIQGKQSDYEQHKATTIAFMQRFSSDELAYAIAIYPKEIQEKLKVFDKENRQ